MLKKVDPTVIKVMQEIGIDISGNRPKMLTREMMDQADKVITMGCGVEGVCSATSVETEDWGLEDLRGKPIDRVREIRDVIKEKVIRLVEEMENQLLGWGCTDELIDMCKESTLSTKEEP